MTLEWCADNLGVSKVEIEGSSWDLKVWANARWHTDTKLNLVSKEEVYFFPSFQPFIVSYKSWN